MGRVGTGFDDYALDTLSASLSGLERATSPFADELPTLDRRDAVWVTPKLVGEVRYQTWTEGNRLRHPSWRGLRDDIDPASVRREA